MVVMVLGMFAVILVIFVMMMVVMMLGMFAVILVIIVMAVVMVLGMLVIILVIFVMMMVVMMLGMPAVINAIAVMMVMALMLGKSGVILLQTLFFLFHSRFRFVVSHNSSFLMFFHIRIINVLVLKILM